MVATAVASPAVVHPAFAQSRSGADIAQARELYNDGVHRREQGDLPGAIEKLRAAHALGNTPITGIELGRTYLLAGNLVEAREAFLSVVRIAREPAETARSKSARDESARLAEQVRPRIPSVMIRLTGVPPETVAVTVDGALVPSEALVAPRLVNPGTHEISARSTSGGTANATIELKEGESRDVELKIVFATQAPTSPAVPPPAPAPTDLTAVPDGGRSPAKAGRRSPLVYVGFGVAAAGVGVGAVTGILSIGKASSVKDQCQGKVCPTSVDGNLKSGRALGDVSTVAFAVAGAGAVVGVLALVLIGHSDDAGSAAIARTVAVHPWLSPTSAGLEGSF
jgi:hypothetical protein